MNTSSVKTKSSIRRATTNVLGVLAVLASVLAGALTSAAAAHEPVLPDHPGVTVPMVQKGMTVIDREITADMRLDLDRPPASSRGRLVAPTRLMKSDCTIGFDDSDALVFQPEHARTQFVADPWRERCGDVWSEVTGTKWNHLHLDYVANDIGPCFDPYSPFNGSYARLGVDAEGDQTCADFDPLTEPRISPRSHSSDEVVRFQMYDIDGYQPFRLDRIRVVDQTIRLCVQPMHAELTVVWGAPQAGALSQASCWNLSAGTWDLSAHTDNTGVVTMTGAVNSGAPFSFDDISITDQS